MQRTGFNMVGSVEHHAMKRFWGYRIFDVIIWSALGSLFVSRLVYIILNIQEFTDARWFWLPYERIDEVVYWFASLPWLFVRLWDGGVSLEGIVAGGMIFLVLLSRAVGIRWGSISNAVADFFWFMFIAIGIAAAAMWEYQLLLYFVVVLLVLGGIRWWANHSDAKTKTAFVYRLISVVWKCATITGVPLVMLAQDLWVRDLDHRWMLVGIDVLVVIIGVGIIAGDVIEFFNPPVEDKRSSAERMQGLTSAVGWRKLTSVQQPPKRLIPQTPPTERNFKRSYKHFSSKWQRTMGAVVARVLRRR